MTPEAKVKHRIKEVLKSYGCYFFMPPANGYGQSGRFDICCSYFGHFIGIEVKSDAGKHPTALQTKNALQARDSGASVLLLHATNLEDLVILLEDVKHHEGKGHTRACVWPLNSSETSVQCAKV